MTLPKTRLLTNPSRCSWSFSSPRGPRHAGSSTTFRRGRRWGHLAEARPSLVCRSALARRTPTIYARPLTRNRAMPPSCCSHGRPHASIPTRRSARHTHLPNYPPPPIYRSSPTLPRTSFIDPGAQRRLIPYGVTAYRLGATLAIGSTLCSYGLSRRRGDGTTSSALAWGSTGLPLRSWIPPLARRGAGRALSSSRAARWHRPPRAGRLGDARGRRARYEDQCAFFDKHGGRFIRMAIRASSRAAGPPDDYLRVYGDPPAIRLLYPPWLRNGSIRSSPHWWSADTARR